MAHFDFIIVGAGTAGCVLAARLSEDPKAKVLLLEAGVDDKRPEVHMPSGYAALQKTKRDWGFSTVEQKGLLNRKLYQPRGKMIGGTGSMNGMIYMRGHRDDYEHWPKGWQWDDVLPFYKKSEDNLNFHNELHGTGGIQTVAFDPWRHKWNTAYVEAAQQAGHSLREDFNDGNPEGIGFYQGTIHKGKRDHTATAFLKKAAKRDNLTIWKETAVLELIGAENGKITELRVLRTGGEVRIKAGGKVILSAGSFNSPALLLRSGIGHEENTIAPIKMELHGVGQNLLDHCGYFLCVKSKEKGSLNTALGVKNLFDYYVRKTGIFSALVSGAGGYAKTDVGLDKSDIQFYFVPGIAGDDIHDWKNQPKFDGYMLGVTLLTHRQPGSVRLTENGLEINQRFLEHPDDYASMRRGYDIAKGILEQPVFDKSRGEYTKPGKELSSEDDYEHFIRSTTEGVYHSVGTCKMGEGSDAVIDGNCKVHGQENLYVVDGSSIPVIPTGNVNSIIVMLAEKASSILASL